MNNAATRRPSKLMRRLMGGMTLVEVLVALFIVALALSMGTKASGSLLNNTQRMIDVTSAQWCANNQLTQLKLRKEFPGVGETAFECQQLGRVYPAKLIVGTTPNPNFRRVQAQVWAEQSQYMIFELTTVIPKY